MNQSIHVLRGAQHKSVLLGFRHAQKPFVVGFVRPSDVIYVSRKITFNSDVRFSKYYPTDVTADVIDGLNEYGVTTKIDRVRIDESAVLQIEKRDSLQFDWLIEQEPLTTFMTYPFARQTGIVIAKKLIEDNEERGALYFDADVIEPSYETKLFQKGLEGLME